jgi:hypothetical protein
VQAVGEAAVSNLLINGTDPYDFAWIQNVAGFDLARPFVGNLNAPASTVGIYAGDACNFFAASGAAAACTLDPTTLISLNAANASGAGVGFDVNNNPIPAVTVSNNQVRYILNASVAQSIFGTPFGARRNLSQDAPFNVFNAALLKNIKFNERASFEFRATALNVLNHAGFRSIDPFLEDAGAGPGAFLGFGDPSVSDTAPSGALGNRIIKVGLTFRF